MAKLVRRCILVSLLYSKTLKSLQFRRGNHTLDFSAWFGVLVAHMRLDISSTSKTNVKLSYPFFVMFEDINRSFVDYVLIISFALNFRQSLTG